MIYTKAYALISENTFWHYDLRWDETVDSDPFHVVSLSNNNTQRRQLVDLNTNSFSWGVYDQGWSFLMVIFE